MDDELNTGTPEEKTPSNKTEGVTVSESEDLKKLVLELKAELTNLKSSLSKPETKPETKAPESDRLSEIEALKADYNKKFEQLENERKTERYNAFLASTKSQLLQTLTKAGLEDADIALEIFWQSLDPSALSQGADGQAYYKNGNRGKGTQLQTVVDEFLKGKIAKRFLPAGKVPNGTNQTGSKPVVSGASSTEKPKKLADIKAGLESGAISLIFPN